MNASEQRTRLPARMVWTRFGVTDRTLDRWLSDADLKFPRPMLIKTRRYFFLDEIEEWERARARKTSPVAA
jgi:predicted DNA-binding transcriptional regulator AlpA